MHNNRKIKKLNSFRNGILGRNVSGSIKKEKNILRIPLNKNNDYFDKNGKKISFNPRFPHAIHRGKRRRIKRTKKRLKSRVDTSNCFFNKLF